MKEFAKKITAAALGCMTFAAALAGCGKTPVSPSEEEKDSASYVEITHAPEYDAVSSEALGRYTTYYFDAENGDDGNDGLSEGTPMKTVTKANAVISSVVGSTPTRVLFKAGSVFSGSTLIVRGTAAEETPLLIGNYGATQENEYAKFTTERANGANAVLTAVVYVNCGNVRISGLEVYGALADHGIKVEATKPGATKNVVISGNYIHDVGFPYKKEDINRFYEKLGSSTRVTQDVPIYDGETTEWISPAEIEYVMPKQRFGPHDTGAIVLYANGSEPAWYENVWVEYNKIERVSRSGIWMKSAWQCRPGNNWGGNKNHYYSDEIGWYPHSNINFTHNDLNVIGGDGIVMVAAVGGCIEYNTVYHSSYLTRTGFYNVGIWMNSCKHVDMQFNEAAYTRGTNKTDSEGLDIDIGNSYCTAQYNYAHHNGGGGILLCNNSTEIQLYDEEGEAIRDEDTRLPVVEDIVAEWHHNYVRNNVFAENYGPVVTLGAQTRDLWFENNTVILPQSFAAGSFPMLNCDNGHDVLENPEKYFIAENWNFNNNLFVLPEGADYRVRCGFDKTKSAFVNGNAFSGFPQSFIDEFNNPGTSRVQVSGTLSLGAVYGALSVRAGFENAAEFRPAVSALFSGAYAVKEINRYDFSGKAKKPNQFYYGAFSE